MTEMTVTLRTDDYLELCKAFVDAYVCLSHMTSDEFAEAADRFVRDDMARAYLRATGEELDALTVEDWHKIAAAPQREPSKWLDLAKEITDQRLKDDR